MTGPTIRIGLMSDLHNEFEADYWNRLFVIAQRGDDSRVADALELRRALEAEPGHPRGGPDLRSLKAGRPDLVLMPGDVDVGLRGVVYADQVARYLGAPVVYVAGNHEAYHSDLKTLVPALHEWAAKTEGRVTYLERERANFDVRGRRIAVCGAMAFTDYKLIGRQKTSMALARDGLNDHDLISYGNRAFDPDDALSIHLATIDWLERETPVARSEADLVIVATHHGPIPDANPEEHRGGHLSPAFTSDLRDRILDWGVDLWVWGHTHHSMEAMLGRTRLASAQRGYVGTEPGAEKFVPAILQL
jgi:predicted phosphodiesterase